MKLWRAAFPVLLLLAACGDREGADRAAGGHADLACEACHAGASTGAFTPPVAAGRCTACHVAVSEQVELAHVTFRHAAHPGPAGDVLSCATCHVHDVGERPLQLTTGNCFLCHADLPPGPDPSVPLTIADDRCIECHAQPTHTAFARSGTPVAHATVLERGISCLLCHYDVVNGTGEVPEASCRSCHGVPGGPLPERPGSAADAASVHATHLADSTSLTCSRCHQPVEHAVIKLASALVLECESCHAPGEPALRPPLDSAVHRPEQLLYAGLAPLHAEVEPALKFLERVACTSCHSRDAMQAATRATAVRTINAECIACHGDRFDDLLAPWLQGMELHASAVRALVGNAAQDARLRRTPAADSLLRAAASALALVDSAHGVHNIPAADRLLRGALADLDRSYRHAGATMPLRPSIGPDPALVSCVRCHYGVELLSGRFQDEAFDHGRHVVDGDLACSACHGTAALFEEDGETFDPAHGTTLIAAADCARCHHVEGAGTCSACHAAPELSARSAEASLVVRVPHGDVRNARTVQFSHARHEAVACASCHRSATPTRPAVECAACHTEHHTEVASPAGCTACHGTGVRRAHEPVDHLACGACHTASTLRLFRTADRTFCLQCHTDQRDHEPGGECSSCHLQIEPDEAMRQILESAGSRPPRRTPP